MFLFEKNASTEFRIVNVKRINLIYRYRIASPSLCNSTFYDLFVPMSGSFCNLDICPIVQLSNCPFVRICIYSDFRRAALRITDIYVQLGHLCGKRGYVSLSICVLWLLGVKKDSKRQLLSPPP